MNLVGKQIVLSTLEAHALRETEARIAESIGKLQSAKKTYAALPAEGEELAVYTQFRSPERFALRKTLPRVI